jgi:hypothetical protein
VFCLGFRPLASAALLSNHLLVNNVHMAARGRKRKQQPEGFTLEDFSTTAEDAAGVLTLSGRQMGLERLAGTPVPASFRSLLPPSPNPLRTIFEELDTAARERGTSSTIKPDQSSLEAWKPATLDDAERFVANISGKAVDLASWLQLEWQAGRLRDAAMGLLGPSSCGKTLFCHLFAMAHDFELVIVHETDSKLLKAWLETATNASIDGATRSRLWVIEHWDAYVNHHPRAIELLRGSIKRMLSTGIVIFTASADYQIQEPEIAWLQMDPLNQTAAAFALCKAASRHSIKLLKHQAIELLDYSDNDVRGALCNLAVFRGAPPILLGQGKESVPGSLRVLSNASLFSPSQLRVNALGEAQAAIGDSRRTRAPVGEPSTPLDMARAELPRAICHKAGCLKVSEGASVHERHICRGDIDHLAQLLEFCSAADVSGCAAELVSGPIQQALHADGGEFEGGILPATTDEVLGRLVPSDIRASKYERQLLKAVFRGETANDVRMLDSFASVPDSFGPVEHIVDQMRLQPWISNTLPGTHERGEEPLQAEVDELVREWNAAHPHGST